MPMLYMTMLSAETVDIEGMTCTKEELMTSFPQAVIESILLKSQLSAEEASKIAIELSQKNQELTQMIETKVSRLDPHPFKDLSQRDLAIKIYRESRYEVFAKVLKAHGITNEDQIQSLLDEIQMAQSKLFIECIRKQHVSSPSGVPSS